ncbi:MAG: type IV pilin [Euryarchaeota archaeon]|nr:type IV pilin [Euryarchaeota archaeon]
MKKSWKKDEGVSPVIATILMVAITVVLAAVLYVMVMIYIPHQEPLLTGNLDYITDKSSPSSGKAVFLLTLGTSGNIATDEAKVVIMDGTAIVPQGSGTWVNWTHIVSGNATIKTGDWLVIEAPGKDLGGCTIILSVNGYTGTVNGKVAG